MATIMVTILFAFSSLTTAWQYCWWRTSDHDLVREASYSMDVASYFLAEIWVGGATLGRELPKTSREKELAKELASDSTQGRVEVVASLY